MIAWVVDPRERTGGSGSLSDAWRTAGRSGFLRVRTAAHVRAACEGARRKVLSNV